MEGGDYKEEPAVPQAVVPPEITDKEPDTIEEKLDDSQKSLTDSILDDDLVVIPSQTEIQQQSSATEQPVATDPSPPSEPEPQQAAVPASEPSQPSSAPPQPVAEPPQPTIKPAQSEPVPPPQPNPETTMKTRPASATVRPSSNPSTKSKKAVELEGEDDDDDFEDETIVERLIGLTEMFPETLCTVAGVTFSLSVSGVKKLFNFSRSALWIGSTSFMILILPIVFETEMVHMEQAQIQRQKQILLGPNAATAGGMTGGMTPPIPGVSVAAPPPEGR